MVNNLSLSKRSRRSGMYSAIASGGRNSGRGVPFDTGGPKDLSSAAARAWRTTDAHRSITSFRECPSTSAVMARDWKVSAKVARRAANEA